MRRFRYGGTGAVEVRADPAAQVWYEASMEDVAEDGIVCSFEDGVWQQGAFPPGDVRLVARPPPPLAAPGEAEQPFAPKVGQLVELRVEKTSASPSGWRHARVAGRQRGLLLVEPTERAADGARRTAIAAPGAVRPWKDEENGLTGIVQKINFAVDPELSAWLPSLAGTDCFGLIEQTVVGYGAREQLQETDDLDDYEQLLRVKHTAPGVSNVSVLGTAAAVRRAKVVAPAILRNQLHIKLCERVLKMREQAIERRRLARRRDRSGTPEPAKLTKELKAHPSRVGQILGRGGHNVRAVQEKFGVKIQILEREGTSATELQTIRITGKDEAQLQQAANCIEFVDEYVAIEEHMVDWAVGRRGARLAQLSRAAGLAECRFEEEQRRLHLGGTREAVERARKLLEVHLLYFDIFRDLGEQVRRAGASVAASGKPAGAPPLESAGSGQGEE